MIDLLSFDPKIAPRLRALKRFAPILAPTSRVGALQGVDAPRAEVPDKDRADVLRVLSCAPPVSAAAWMVSLTDTRVTLLACAVGLVPRLSHASVSTFLFFVF